MYSLSVIVPVYNAAKYLTLTIIELINENSEKKEP